MSGSRPFTNRARSHDPSSPPESSPPASIRRGWKRIVAALTILGAAAFVVPSLATPGSASAAILPGGLTVNGVVPVSSQFDVTGVVQAATLDILADAHSGGTVTVNGQLIVIPRETIAILPANALTWQQLFAEAPAPYAPSQSGLAKTDVPTPLASYEINVIGNRVTGKSCQRPGSPAGPVATDCYIAGLVHISQQDLNSGAGYINYIDYNVSGAAEMRVGGTINDPKCIANPANTVAGGSLCSGARVRINDPSNPGSIGASGRFGRAGTPDARFMVDQDNPTITAATGYPMCIPRGLIDPTTNLNPATASSPDDTDTECPLTNRVSKADGTGTVFPGAMIDPTQIGGFAITTLSGAGIGTIPGYVADPTKQIPMETGDYITYAGTLVNDTATPTVAVAGATTYISAHTIVNNFAAYTRPGVNPAYVSVEVSLVGTGGLTVFGAGEAAVRTRFEGMTTDPTRNVHVYAVDLSGIDGSQSDRDWGVVSPDPGPPGGAVMGRWRLRPPCKVTAGSPVTDKICAVPAQGDYIPPTRELRAVIDGGAGSTVSPNTGPNPQTPGFVAPLTAASPTASNGIAFGQYHAPIGEYIFPENIPGNPIPPNNFETLAFLANGGYTSGGITPTLAKQLAPWPGAVSPTLSKCAVANAGGPYTVPVGGSVVMTGSAGTGVTGTVSYSWSAPTPNLGTLSTKVGQSTTYQSVAGTAIGTQVTFTLTVTQLNAPGCPATTTSLPVTVTYGPNPNAPTVSSLKATQNTVNSAQAATFSLQAQGQFHSTATGSGVLQTGTFRFIQVGGPPVTLSNGGVSAAVSCTIAANATSCTVPQGSVNITTPAGFIATGTNALKFVATLTSTTKASTSGASAPVTVTVSPNVAVNIVLTTVQYRQSNQRLDITATYTGPNVLPVGNALAEILKLQPYLTTTNSTFDPATLGSTFTNTGGGIYTITVVGAQPPACNGVGAAYVTPCAIAPIVVEAFGAPGSARPGVLEGVSIVTGTALTNIR